jgi:putative nucleotidyltransferase with HDIG domain
MHGVSVKDLTVGMVLAEDVIDNEGRIVYPQNSILTEKKIERLRELLLNIVQVQDAEEAPLKSFPTVPDSNIPTDQDKKEDRKLKRPFLQYLFQHSSLDNPLMSKLYEECEIRLPDNVEFQPHYFHRLSPFEMVKRIKKVTILPSIYFRLSEAISNLETSTNDLAKIINDSGLAAVILRTVNSAHFGLPKKIDSVAHSITILGTRQLCDLVLAFTVVKSFDGISQNLINIESFCHHSVACGVFARELAIATKQQNPERYFTAGLLHDIGRLVLFNQCPKEFSLALQRSREFNELLYLCERKTLGFDHSDVGAMLLEYWGVPNILHEAVRYHHTPQLAPSSGIDAYIIHFADILTNAFQLGTSGEHLIPPLHSKALAVLKIQPQHLSVIIERGLNQIDEILKLILLKE